MALDEGTHPDFFTGHRVTRVETADNAKLITGRTVNQQDFTGLLVFNQRRCTGHGVASLVVFELLLPDYLAGVFIQRDHRRVQSTEEHQIAENGSTAIHNITARADVIGKAVRV